MTSPVIEIRGLTKRYGKLLALDALDLSLAPGPTGLLGPNGAGKTTLIKLVLGLLRPDAGAATIAGCDPFTANGRLALKRVIGYMPEGDCLIPGLSAVELVCTLGRLSGLSETDSLTRTHEVLDYVGLDESRYRPADGYSTGMKQRLKLAQALVHDPELLLLDEPTNGLDPKARRHMLELVHDLGHVQGKNLLVCSHLLPDVEQTCRDVVVLAKGRAVVSGTIRDLTGPTDTRLWIEFEGESAVFETALTAAGFGYDPAGPPRDATPQRDAISVAFTPADPAGGVATTTTDAPAREVAEFVAGPAGSLHVRLRAGEDDADALFAVAARAGIRIRRIARVRSSLEDIFLAGLAKGDAA